jgi:hypothetical protein
MKSPSGEKYGPLASCRFLQLLAIHLDSTTLNFCRSVRGRSDPGSSRRAKRAVDQASFPPAQLFGDPWDESLTTESEMSLRGPSRLIRAQAAEIGSHGANCDADQSTAYAHWT